MCLLPSDVDKKRTDQLAYRYEMILRVGPWYHPGISADFAFLAGYGDGIGWLTGRLGYSLATVAP